MASFISAADHTVLSQAWCWRETGTRSGTDVGALQTGRFGQFPNRQLINVETDGNKHLSWCQDRKMNDFHNTRVSLTRQTPYPKS